MNKKDYKYGTAEYLIAEASEKMEGALNLVQQVRKEIGIIVPVSQIVFGGGISSTSRIEGIRSVDDYFNLQRTYSRWGHALDPSNKEHLERAYNNCLKFAQEASDEIEKWHAENLEAIENNKKVADNIRSFMSTVGIPATYYSKEIYRKKSRSVTNGAGYLGDITRNCITNDGYEARMKDLADLRRRAAEWLERSLKVLKEKEAVKQKSDKEVRLIAKALELYGKFNLEDPYTTNDQLVAIVTAVAKEKWIEENFPDGLNVDQDACGECGGWTVGEHRCDCGNRRIYLEVDGNILDGFEGYPMGN